MLVTIHLRISLLPHVVCKSTKIETCKSKPSLRNVAQAATLLSCIQEMPNSSLWLYSNILAEVFHDPLQSLQAMLG